MARVFPQIKNQIDPSYNASRYDNVQKFKPASGSAEALQIQSINNMAPQLQTLSNIFTSMNNTNFPWANKQWNDIKQNWSNDPQAQKALAGYSTMKSFINGDLA